RRRRQVELRPLRRRLLADRQVAVQRHFAGPRRRLLGGQPVRLGLRPLLLRGGLLRRRLFFLFLLLPCQVVPLHHAPLLAHLPPSPPPCAPPAASSAACASAWGTPRDRSSRWAAPPGARRRPAASCV